MEKIRKEKTVEKKLNEVEKRCKKRTINSVDRIKIELGKIVEKFENLGFSRHDLIGLEISYTEGCGQFANAYKFIPEGTYFHAIYDGKSWEITDIGRQNCNRRWYVMWTLNDKTKWF